jgi:hypothetical protein
MNSNHVIDSWIAELRLAPRRRRRRQERAVVGEGRRRIAPRERYPSLPAVAIRTAAD